MCATTKVELLKETKENAMQSRHRTKINASLLILPMWRWFAYWRPRLICFAGLGCVNKQEPISCCPCCAVAVLCTQSVILQYTTHYCADPTRPDPMRRTLLLSRQHGRTLANPPDLHHFWTPQSEQKSTNFPERWPPIQ